MNIKLGEVIKAKRKEMKYSLVDFSKAVGISPGYLSQLENGRKANPKLEIILKVIKELGIDIDILLGIENTGDNINVRIPALLKLVLAKERNINVLEDKETLKKFCDLNDKLLESKYLIDNPLLYGMFLEDICIHIDTTIKRYLAFQLIN